MWLVRSLYRGHESENWDWYAHMRCSDVLLLTTVQEHSSIKAKYCTQFISFSGNHEPNTEDSCTYEYE